FLNDFENNNLEMPSDLYTWTLELINVTTEHYEFEDDRAKVLREKLSQKLAPIILQQYKGRSSCDGVSFVKVERYFIAYQLFLEIKNELGLGGCDPTVQGAIYYKDHWTQLSSIQISECCCAPSFIIVVAGPWICVLGCIFLSKVIVQPLTDFIPLTIGVEDFDQVERIVRLFYALHLAICRLEEFYKGLDMVVNDQKYFPYFNHYITEGKKMISFTYHYQFESVLAWKAETVDGRIVVVKYFREYNIEAHEFCAKKSFAPKILHVANPEELRKFSVVITDFVPGTILIKKDKIHPKFYQGIYDNVESIVNFSHEQNFVCGNLSPANIITNEKNGKPETMLISFDRCGIHQVNKYPPSIKNNNLPSGVGPGSLLDNAHDTYFMTELWAFLMSE
ncbi:24319_t:CDS:2, partial [Racocetra persica]